MPPDSPLADCLLQGRILATVSSSETLLSCANCAATIRDDYAEVAGWRYWTDGVGELHLFCEICSVVEFAPDAPASAKRME